MRKLRVPCRACPLRAKSVFKTNTAAEIDFIQSMKSEHLHIAPGQPIMTQGRANPRLFTLFSGWAFRYKELPDGRRQILNFLLPGDFIGFQGQMSGDSPFGVEALTPVEICVFARGRIWELYRNYPELAFDITWLTAHEESLVDENLLTAGRRSALERVAMLMLHLCKRAGALQPGLKGPYALPVNQTHIADALGLSLAHTNKTLRLLEKKGLFRFRAGRLDMIDSRAIEKLADYFDDPILPRPLI